MRLNVPKLLGLLEASALHNLVLLNYAFTVCAGPLVSRKFLKIVTAVVYLIYLYQIMSNPGAARKRLGKHLGAENELFAVTRA